MQWKQKGYLKSGAAAACSFLIGLFSFVWRSQMRIFTAGFEPPSLCLPYCLKPFGCDRNPTALGLALLTSTAVH